MDRMQQLEVRMMLMNFYRMQVGSTPGQMLCHWCNNPRHTLLQCPQLQRVLSNSRARQRILSLLQRGSSDNNRSSSRRPPALPPSQGSQQRQSRGISRNSGSSNSGSRPRFTGYSRLRALVLGAGEGERDADESQSDEETSIDDDFHEEIDTPPIESTDEHEPPPSTSDF